MQVIDSSFHGLFAVFAVQNGCFVLHLAYLNFFPFLLDLGISVRVDLSPSIVTAFSEAKAKLYMHL